MTYAVRYKLVRRRLPGVDVDVEIERLYGLPHDEFVAERDKLAKQLKTDREAAAAVKALRKPTVGAWALNQAVRRRRAETEALLETGERLRAAHEQLLSGGDPAELRDAMRAERELTSKLADCAEAIASEAGKSGPALRDRVRATLHAASVDAEAREELASGRFVREREAVGLGAFGTSEAATDAPAPAKAGGKRARGGNGKRARGGAGRASRTGDGRASRGGGSASAAGERAPTREERAAEVARAREERAAAEERAREERFAEAEAELDEARDALASAEADHEATLATLEDARAALREAEIAEREARRTAREHSREVAKQERALERMRPKG
jgi:hypothetical protein